MIQRNDLYPQMMQMLEEHGMQNEPVKLVGIRNEENQADDVINDYFLHCLDNENVFLCAGTTDPGIHSLVTHPDGPAHLCLGAHKNIWVIGTHAKSVSSFAHEALCSRPDRGCKPITFFRDKDKNFIYSSADSISGEYVGLNMHRMSVVANRSLIGLYSEGCQVRVDHLDHEELMRGIKCVPEVAATHFIGSHNKSFYDEEPGKDYWSYLFSYLLTPLRDWQI